jgi:glucosamine--fructose-6-phosphate aminotransferase (isomerizing)
MCGIVGYIGNKQALPILLQGLRDLEYRGYDSAGVAVLAESKIKCVREVGKVNQLTAKLSNQEILGTVGIAHTRWATHGGVSEKNAHPHVVNGKLALVHNGIIENYREIKQQLQDQKFASETDTEVLAKLIYENYHGDLTQAVRESLKQVRGTYGLVVMHTDHPHQLVAARLGSPLAIGIGANQSQGNEQNMKEFYIASDVTPILPFTKSVTFLDDGEIATLNHELKIINLRDQIVNKKITEIDWDLATAQKGGYEHFMLKEIFDQPGVLEDALRGRMDMEEGTAKLGGLNMTSEQMRSITRIIIIAEGTARHAGLIGKFAFERLANLPTEVDFASEFRYRDPIVNKNTLVFVISQSGETADTLMAAREAKRKGAFVRGVVNAVGSTIARETGAGTYIHAGPELSVASTKAYTNMCAVLILYALEFGRIKHASLSTGQRILLGLMDLPEKMNEVLKQNETIKLIAQKYQEHKDLLFLGKGINYPVALEGALKLEEISYIHAEGLPAGSLKHGPLALVSAEVPVVVILTKNALYEKMKSTILEVRARGAKTIVIANEGDEEAKEVADDIIYVPKTMELLEPLLNTIPLQLFAYHVAVGLGRDVDRPRNLAKSVTVE